MRIKLRMDLLALFVLRTHLIVSIYEIKLMCETILRFLHMKASFRRLWSKRAEWSAAMRLYLPLAQRVVCSLGSFLPFFFNITSVITRCACNGYAEIM